MAGNKRLAQGNLTSAAILGKDYRGAIIFDPRCHRLQAPEGCRRRWLSPVGNIVPAVEYAGGSENTNIAGGSSRLTSYLAH